MGYPAERCPVDGAQVGRTVAQDHVPVAGPQMGKERVRILDVLQDPEQDDDVGVPCGLGGELSCVEVADDGLRVPRDEIAAPVAASVRQEALERHLPAAKIEHTGSPWNELRGEFRARIPVRL